jgi:hypothetical protein
MLLAHFREKKNGNVYHKSGYMEVLGVTQRTTAKSFLCSFKRQCQIFSMRMRRISKSSADSKTSKGVQINHHHHHHHHHPIILPPQK